MDEPHNLDRDAAIALLKSSVEKWNIYRQAHPDWKPVLSSVYDPADFTRACLCGADLREVDLSGANLRGADLRRVGLRRADLFRVRLCRADLHAANLQKANLHQADLHEAVLNQADLRWVNFREAHLNDAKLVCADLHETDLTGAGLHRARLNEANLIGADFSGADLQAADLRSADLTGANFANASLVCTDLRGAILREADFDGADLDGADLRGADIWRAKLGNVKRSWAKSDEDEPRDADVPLRQRYWDIQAVREIEAEADDMLDSVAEDLAEDEYELPVEEAGDKGGPWAASKAVAGVWERLTRMQDDPKPEGPAHSRLGVIVACPRRLSKGRSSRIVIRLARSGSGEETKTQMDQPAQRPGGSPHPLGAFCHPGVGTAIIIEYPDIKFSRPLKVTMTGSLTTIEIRAEPYDSANLGEHDVKLDLRDPASNPELIEIPLRLRVSGYTFRRMTVPVLTRIISLTLGALGLAAFALAIMLPSFRLPGLTCGVVLAAVAGVVEVQAYRMYRQMSVRFRQPSVFGEDDKEGPAAETDTSVD